MLEEWIRLFSRLCIDLECFGIPLTYAGKLSTRLDETWLIDFTSRSGFEFPHNCAATLIEQQLDILESKLEFFFPHKYRNYCQVFGPGRFGLGGFSINGPYFNNFEEHFESERSIMDGAKECYVKAGWDEVRELLENAYPFGGGGQSGILVFDLRTYSEKDCSYDIYVVDHDWGQCGLTYFLGRDFFSLIEKICFDNFPDNPDLRIELPWNLSKDEPKYISYQTTTFIPFPIMENLPE